MKRLKGVTRCFVVDSYAWAEYFDKNPAYKQLIQEKNLKTPSSVIAEISRVMARRGISKAESQKILDYVARRSVILSLDFDQAVKAGRMAERERLDFADAIAYSYASEDEPLLTGDGNFSGKKNVFFVK